mgnify:FL=1
MERWGQGREQTVKVSFRITNTGMIRGREIWQVYVRRQDVGKRERRVTYPLRVLREFGSVDLEAGKSRLIELSLAVSDFSYFDILCQDWRMSEGIVSIDVGASSRDIRLGASITLDRLVMDAPAITCDTPMSAVLDVLGAEESLVKWLMEEETMSQQEARDLLARGRKSFLGIYDTLSWSLGHEPQIEGLMTVLVQIGRNG